MRVVEHELCRIGYPLFTKGIYGDKDRLKKGAVFLLDEAEQNRYVRQAVFIGHE